MTKTDGDSNALLLLPDAYGLVQPGLYRSATPSSDHIPFLQNLRLRTVLLLAPETLSRAVLNFLQEEDIKLVHLGLSAWKPENTWKPCSEELIKEGLQLLLDADQAPVLVACSSGVNETGMLVGCLRRLQHWSLGSVLSEYRIMSGIKARYANEQFIELFDLDLVSYPQNLTEWFIQDRAMLVG
ncbi:MAG: protein-tyrosine phosphatase [Piptocephalis tieghemiana]|nr:MAG: protein-tyrosine phosphatase [Piptocephalis tieghemiana]